MNNNFSELAEQFVNIFEREGGADWDDEEREQRIREFISHQGIDEAWEDELFEQIEEALENAS